MKKIKTLAFILVFLVKTTFSQILWVDNFQVAKQLAAANNKLILIDFWAEWCGPCKLMESDLWKLPEVVSASRNFIPVKINTDYDPSTASDYGVKGIPMVALVTCTGELIWSNVGYRHPSDYVAILKSVPGEVASLNSALLAGKNTKDADELFQLGIEYQDVGKVIPNDVLRSSFLAKSNAALSKSGKAAKEITATLKAELFSILNDVYLGRTKNAIKRIGKAVVPDSDKELNNLKHLILAGCFKLEGDQARSDQEKQLISDEEFREELDRLGASK